MTSSGIDYIKRDEMPGDVERLKIGNAYKYYKF
jgi:hypothetical protein